MCGAQDTRVDVSTIIKPINSSLISCPYVKCIPVAINGYQMSGEDESSTVMPEGFDISFENIFATTTHTTCPPWKYHKIWTFHIVSAQLAFRPQLSVPFSLLTRFLVFPQTFKLQVLLVLVTSCLDLVKSRVASCLYNEATFSTIWYFPWREWDNVHPFGGHLY